jgi:hypothetical protein
VKENVDVIKSRHSYAKVAVLLDWDSESRVASFRQLFKSQDPFVCTAWDKTNANPKLSDDFRGIERFFSDRLIRAVEAARPEIIFTNPSGIKTFRNQNRSLVKSLLNVEVKKGLELADTRYAKTDLNRLLAMVQ